MCCKSFFGGISLGLLDTCSFVVVCRASCELIYMEYKRAQGQAYRMPQRYGIKLAPVIIDHAHKTGCTLNLQF